MKVTRKVYKDAKKLLNNGAGTHFVKTMSGLSSGTISVIRNSSGYTDYKRRINPKKAIKKPQYAKECEVQQVVFEISNDNTRLAQWIIFVGVISVVAFVISVWNM